MQPTRDDLEAIGRNLETAIHNLGGPSYHGYVGKADLLRNVYTGHRLPWPAGVPFREDE